MNSLRRSLEVIKKPSLDLSVRQLAGRLIKDAVLISTKQFIEKVTKIVDALNQFEQSVELGVWPKISKDQLIEDIRKTVVDPFQVDQDHTEFCGPASIVFELVTRKPHQYVQYCQHLYETGQIQGKTKLVKPSHTLLNSQVRSGISLADWMLMATLRDTENVIFPVEESSGPIAMGVTTPWEMKGWTSEILGYDQVEYESTYIYGEFDAMRLAEKTLNNGGVAFLMIHSAMIGSDEPIVSYPTHWVSFLGNLAIDEGVQGEHGSGHIKFDCYSWGRVCHVDLGEGTFEDYMWGAVMGK